MRIVKALLNVTHITHSVARPDKLASFQSSKTKRAFLFSAEKEFLIDVVEASLR